MHPLLIDPRKGSGVKEAASDGRLGLYCLVPSEGLEGLSDCEQQDSVV